MAEDCAGSNLSAIGSKCWAAGTLLQADTLLQASSGGAKELESIRDAAVIGYVQDGMYRMANTEAVMHMQSTSHP